MGKRSVAEYDRRKVKPTMTEMSIDGVHKVKVERLGNGMFVEVNGQRRLAPLCDGDILPSNLWNRAILTEDKILHPPSRM